MADTQGGFKGYQQPSGQEPESPEKPSNTQHDLLPRAFALAWAAASADRQDRCYVFHRVRALSGRELLEFVSEVSKLRGWGRGLQRAVADWYNTRLPERVLAEAQSCPEVSGWTHGRLLRIVRPIPASGEHGEAFRMLVADEDRRRAKLLQPD